MELYNVAVKQYNLAVDGKTITEEQHTALKNKLDTEKKLFDERADALKQYESTLDEVRDTTDNIEENMRSIADKKLEKIKFRLEVVLDVKSMKETVRDLSKEISEIFGDTLTQNFMGYDKFNSPLALDAEAAKAEANLMPQYKQQYEELKALYDSTTDDAARRDIMDEISDLQGKIADSAKAIVEWVNSIEDIVPDAVDAAAERFAAFTD
jgi:chromosome segregation ATPase